MLHQQSQKLMEHEILVPHRVTDVYPLILHPGQPELDVSILQSTQDHPLLHIRM